METPAKTGKIIGPPGTGKTTYIMKLIEAACEKYDPSKIGAVSYTNAAVNEMKSRISRKTGISPDTAKNCRTIHAHCFRLLELKRDNVADEKIKEWNEFCLEESDVDGMDFTLPLKSSLTEDDHYEDDFKITEKRNLKIFNRMQIYRNHMDPPETWADKYGDNGEVAYKFWEKWQKWMWRNDLTDFTGMLEKTYEQELTPDIDILFVDEANDLTPLQLRIMERWSEDTVSTIYAGDADQAIFKFAGAAPEVFMDLEHQWGKVLEQSFRVPEKVHDYAMQLISYVHDREKITYRPRDEEGELILDIRYPELDREGSHMIITRCNYHLNKWRKYLIKKGLVWHNPYRPGDKNWNPTKTKLWRAATAYVKLKYGGSITVEDFRVMIDRLISQGNLVRGAKNKMEEIFLDPEKKLDLFSLSPLGIFTDEFMTLNKPVVDIFKISGQVGKILTGISNEDDVLKKPNIIIGTFHSIKGGEADNVWVDLATSPQCYRAITVSEKTDSMEYYDEIRVAYVAATRARQCLGTLITTNPHNPAFIYHKLPKGYMIDPERYKLFNQLKEGE